MFYKIGEACRTVDIQPYVLRYWETEFSFLKPEKSKSGQRVYTEREIGLIRRIKELLYVEGYTIAGAKKRLENELANGKDGPEAKGTESSASTDSGIDSVTDEDEEKVIDIHEDTAVHSAPAERIKSLEEGVLGALEEVRDLLGLLEDEPSD